MRKKRIAHKLNKKEQEILHEHLDNHVCQYYHKNFDIVHESHHQRSHIWELILVLLLWCTSWIFAGNVWLPSNNSFVYPIQQVSTIECRTEYRGDMDSSCKIPLPRITNANYQNYINSQIHRQIYTVLRAAPYSAWWDQTAWAHGGLDIATARGTPLYSIGDGQVTYAWRQNGYGNVVKIKYLFRWEYIHAVYGHMDIIEVEAWQRVSAWQRIGTVGNSWTTFWALGWFHVHFEITRDNRGRPMYGYLWCPDLDKWHMTIIREWLCRKELLANHYDPIVLFEQNRLGHVIPQLTPANRWDEIHEGEIDYQQEIDIIEEIELTQEDILSKEEQTIAQIQEEQKQIIQTQEELEREKITEEKEKPILETNEKEKKIESIEEKEWRKGEKIEIDTEWMSDEIQHFFKTHELYIDNQINDNQLTISSNKKIEINFYRRWTDQKFIGVLPFTLELIPSQTNLSTNINNLQLISPNDTIVQVKWIRSGNSTLLFSINWKTIYRIPFKIN